MQGLQRCVNCSSSVGKCRKRDFSEQAWSMLLAWGEIEAAVVDEPICDQCYKELREILIDRADDVFEGVTVSKASEVAKVSQPSQKPAKTKKVIGKTKKVA